ncbi:MAG: hypothetical protein Q4D38_05125 [Planctomycetia bacterium]|nr:hypothetical protein [Planctomycetia bacterium]
MPISMSFEACPLPVALSTISAETGVSIVWSASIDDTLVSGTFVDENLGLLLAGIAKRYNLKFSDLGGVYFLGEASATDKISVVVRSPFSDLEVLEKSLLQCLSDSGKVSCVGSCLVISDYFQNLREVLGVISSIRSDSLRSYIAEVFFVRLHDSELFDLQAHLESNGIDIFSSSFNLKTLFSMYVDVTGEALQSRMESRPILYLSEGRKSTLEVGSDVVRSRYSISETGYSSVTGYETFSDGVSISLTPFRVSNDVISVDVDLSVSSFDGASLDSIPASNKSRLLSPGVLLADGEVFFVGSLRVLEESKKGVIFGLSSSKDDEIVTVWVKIREVSLKNSGKSL